MGKVKRLNNFQMIRNMNQNTVSITPTHQPDSRFSIPSSLIVCGGIHQCHSLPPPPQRDCSAFGPLRLVHTIPSIESKLSTHSFYTLDLILPYSSVQFSHSVMSNSLRPHESQHARPPCPSPSLISHLILCRPLLLLPSIPPSIRVFSTESNLRMRWPKYWSFSFSIIPSKEHPRPISFRMDWLDLLAVQGTLKSLLEHHSSKHQFFGTQLSSQSNSHIHTCLLEKP